LEAVVSRGFPRTVDAAIVNAIAIVDRRRRAQPLGHGARAVRAVTVALGGLGCLL
jgi:hypothetical protein